MEGVGKVCGGNGRKYEGSVRWCGVVWGGVRWCGVV